MTYRSTEHLHNFACWTAAAAVRRGFTTNRVIAYAIESSKMQLEADEYLLNGGDYQKIHDKLCKALANSLKRQARKQEFDKKDLFLEKCTFGRMAKIVAIYMKTYVVLPNLNNPKLTKVLASIYPPIDQILLDGIARKNDHFKSIAKRYRWSLAKKTEYYELKEDIEKEGMHFNWTLEVYWKGFRRVEE